MLADAAACFPEQTALICGPRSLNYTQYLRCVAGLAEELAGYGARAGRVALVCANSLDVPIATFGAHAAGAQAVPINPTYTERELGYILKDADPIAVIYDAEVASKVEPLAAALGIAHTVLIGEGGRTFDVWKNEPERRLPEPRPSPHDLATLQYTGGTTGLPKGVNISHRQLAVNISQREAALPTKPGDESNPLHDADVPRLRGRDVSASFGPLRRAACDHAALAAGGGARPHCAGENHPPAGRADRVHRFTWAREIQSDRFLLLAHGLFGLRAAAGGNHAAMVGANRHADPGGLRANGSRACADLCARGRAVQSRLGRSHLAAHHN
jgi:hypothetical protein